MEEALRALLLGSGAVAAITDRVSWIERPQASQIPAVVLMRVSRVPMYDHGGPADLEMARVQADCYSSTVAEAKALGRAVVRVLSGHRDDVFSGIFCEGERDGRDEGAEGLTIFRVSQDYLVHYKEIDE